MLLRWCVDGQKLLTQLLFFLFSREASISFTFLVIRKNYVRDDDHTVGRRGSSSLRWDRESDRNTLTYEGNTKGVPRKMSCLIWRCCFSTTVVSCNECRMTCILVLSLERNTCSCSGIFAKKDLIVFTWLSRHDIMKGKFLLSCFSRDSYRIIFIGFFWTWERKQGHHSRSSPTLKKRSRKNWHNRPNNRQIPLQQTHTISSSSKVRTFPSRNLFSRNKRN